MNFPYDGIWMVNYDSTTRDFLNAIENNRVVWLAWEYAHRYPFTVCVEKNAFQLSFPWGAQEFRLHEEWSHSTIGIFGLSRHVNTRMTGRDDKGFSIEIEVNDVLIEEQYELKGDTLTKSSRLVRGGDPTCLNRQFYMTAYRVGR
jgi:hypothetical protein